MASRLAKLLVHDARLQYRNGIHFAYAVVVGFYVMVLVYGRDFLPPWLPGLIIFTDPAVVGFFFLGSLMLLEKAENVRSALGVTPLSGVEYFWSKCLTLTALAMIAVSALTPFLHSGAEWPLLMAAVALTSVQYLGIGIPAARHFQTATTYLMGAAAWLIPIIAPGFLALLEPMPAWAVLIPAASQFRLILIGTGAANGNPAEIASMVAVCMLAAIAGVWLALRQLDKEFGRK